MQRIKEPLDELPVCSDEELITKYLLKRDTNSQRRELTWIELGCGNAELMRKLVAAQSQQSQTHNQQGADSDATATTTNAIIKKVIALEVDKQQHAKNLQLDNVPSIFEFGIGGMENIPSLVSNNSVDAVIMLKSLHHVGNAELLRKGFDEVYRVLKPGKYTYRLWHPPGCMIWQ